MVVGGKARECRKQTAFLGTLDMRFDCKHAFGLGQLEDRIEQGQQFEVVLLVVFRTLERGLETVSGFSKNEFRIRGNEGADTRTADDHKLERLPKRRELAAHGHIATDHTNDHNDPSDNNEHARRSIWMPVTKDAHRHSLPYFSRRCAISQENPPT